VSDKVYCPSCHHKTARQTCSECGAAPVLLQRFVLEDMLGHGAQGFTWLAKPIDGSPHVAIKELSFRRLDTFKNFDLFKREVDVLRSLDHPSIPRFLEDFYVEEGRHVSVYLVQEFIEGSTLNRRVSQDEAVEVLRQILTVLEYLHNLEPPVIHRDIKPSNIMRRPDKSLVLIDFGSTRAALESSMGGSTIAGTVGFMAPEQLIGRSSPASDLYGLGATIVTLLAGQSVLDLIDSSRPGSWKSKVAIDHGLQAVLSRMLEPEPVKRTQEARSVLRELSDWEQGTESDTRREQKEMGPMFTCVSEAPLSSITASLQLACDNMLVAVVVAAILMGITAVAIAAILGLGALVLGFAGIDFGENYFSETVLPVIWMGFKVIFGVVVVLVFLAPWLFVRFGEFAHRAWPDFYSPMPPGAAAFLRHRRWSGLKLSLTSLLLPNMWGWAWTGLGTSIIIGVGNVLLFGQEFGLLAGRIAAPRVEILVAVGVAIFVLLRVAAHSYILHSRLFSRRSLGVSGLAQVHAAVEDAFTETNPHVFTLNRGAVPEGAVEEEIQAAEAAVNLFRSLAAEPLEGPNTQIPQEYLQKILDAPSPRNARLLRFLSDEGTLDQGWVLFEAASAMEVS